MDQNNTIADTKQAIKLPNMWHVILHNDDYTPFDFVTELLTLVFNKTSEEAANLANTVHSRGKATVGLYTKEIADTKVGTAMQIAAGYQHPLLLTAESA